MTNDDHFHINESRVGLTFMQCSRYKTGIY